MRNDQNSNRTAVTIFAVALIVALTAAFVMTFQGFETTRASNDTQPGTIGLAKSHPPLDRASGEPLQN
jgi:hypothetical protein